MDFVKEKVRKKVPGWKSLVLSYVERKTTIKSIAFAILVYLSSCFFFLKKMVSRSEWNTLSIVVGPERRGEKDMVEEMK